MPTTEIDLQPTLRGNTLILRPLTEADLDDLHAAASDPLLWEQHPEPLRYQRSVFIDRFFNSAIASRGAFAAVDLATGKIIGSSRYYDWNPQTAEIAIGFSFITRPYWGKGTNREMKFLMLSHIFQWAERVWFHVGKNNMRSRKAMEKIGGTLTHIEGKLINGVNIESAYFKIERAEFMVNHVVSGGTE